MLNERPTGVAELKKGRQQRRRDSDADRPADVLPFRPRPPDTPADPPTSTVRGGRLTKQWTSTPGLSMTLSINVDDLVRAMVAAEAQRVRAPKNRRTRHQRQAQNTGGVEPSSRRRAVAEASPALDVLPHLYGRDPQRVARFQRDVQTNANFLVRGRAGAMVSTLVGHDAPALKSLGDLATYRKIMGDGTWWSLIEAVRVTRSYEAGLDLGLLLLRVIELHEPHLSRQEVAAHRRQLYWFILDMLARLDQWEAYLATWERVRAHTAETVTVQPCARDQPGLAPFILSEDASGLRVHCLWPLLHRKELIERKVARQRRGQKLGNVTHASQDDLSTADLRERVAWVARARQVRDAFRSN